MQYTQYETALTRERQEVGFATLTTAEGLSTAATLVTPVATKSILSGLTTAVIATKGHYDSEILMDQTMRTIQKQMRASRNKIAEHISARMAQDIVDYPLSAALADVEEYYRAGTLTTGIIDTSTTVGIEEDRTKEQRMEIARLPAAARRAAILGDTVTVIPTPTRLPVLVPTGTGFAEQRLTPARTRRLQRFVCADQTGDFSTDLRTQVVQRLRSINRKDMSFPDRITVIDENTVRRELRTNPPNCPG